MAGRLLANKVAVKSCKLASPKRCKKACVSGKAQPAIVPSELLPPRLRSPPALGRCERDMNRCLAVSFIWDEN
ncbi:MAG: hypothetical protein WBL40_21075, partial [Terrimicrobiaceae bacterium]